MVGTQAKRMHEKVNAGQTLILVSLKHTTHSIEATLHRIQLEAHDEQLLLKFKRQHEHI